MSRSATLAGPGTARSPSAHFRTVRSSTSSAFAASRCVMPSAAMASRNSSADTAHDALGVNAEPGRAHHGVQRLQRVVRAVGRVQRAVRAEDCQTLGLVLATADEANGIGRQDGGAGQRLAHAALYRPIGPTYQEGKRMPASLGEPA